MTPDEARPDRAEPDSPESHQVGPHLPHAADATAQSELDLGVVPTGSAAVDRALVPLEDLADSPVDQHPTTYARVLGDLAATMSEPTASASVAPGEQPASD